jgi:hypothetical protein
MAGDEIHCTNGLRKVRLSRTGMEKRGEAQVIYAEGKNLIKQVCC